MPMRKKNKQKTKKKKDAHEKYWVKQADYKSVESVNYGVWDILDYPI